jgi:hypothetical protein
MLHITLNGHLPESFITCWDWPRDRGKVGTIIIILVRNVNLCVGYKNNLFPRHGGWRVPVVKTRAWIDGLLQRVMMIGVAWKRCGERTRDRLVKRGGIAIKRPRWERIDRRQGGSLP